MRARRWLPVATGVILMTALSAASARGQVALGGKAGSLGLGLELTVGLSPQWNARLGANGFNYTDDHRKVSQIEYDATAKLRTATALLDWHPGGRGFRLSGGLVYNDTRIDGTSLVPASGIYDIGGVPVPAALVGTLSGRIDFDPVVPYLGIGWGNAVGPGRKVGFFLDAGAMFQGKGKVKLTPNIPPGSPLNNPTARAALGILLQREENDIENDVADYTVYPVVAIGVTYRF
ncbi:MAG TPA: hypothetical protein VGM86_08655 [Thermoanaerobaculia bacterium]